MKRKYLFWGLTLVLLVVLVNLIIRAHRLEIQQASRPVEVVQESKSTATRVLTPQDLEIVNSKMQLEEEPGKNSRARIARHEIEIRNNGKVPYDRIQLSLDYVDRSRKVLVTQTYSITQTLLPGNTLKLADIKVAGLPASTANYGVAIAYADMASLPLSQKH